MPYPARNGDIVVSRAEWRNLTGSTLPDDETPTPERVIRDYEYATNPHLDLDPSAIAAALVKAGLPGGTDVPPSDVPDKIRQLGEMLERARHQAQTLAGEVADLTDRLDRDLPRIFGTVWSEMLRGANLDNLEDVGELALSMTLRLVTDHELRERDAPRPRRLDCGCDPWTLGARPLSAGDVWSCPHGNRWRGDGRDGWRHETTPEYLAAHPIPMPSAFVDYFTRDAPVVGSDGLTVDNTSPASVPSNPAVGGVPDVVDYDRDDKATALWGIPLDVDHPHHPAVHYLADTLDALGVRFVNCDGSRPCRRKIITQALRDHLQGVEMGLTGHNTAVEHTTNALYEASDPSTSRGAILDAVRLTLTYTNIFPTPGEQARG